MLRSAFKEWAIICQLLAEGRQAVILRKGGINETGGQFHVEHRRFWLYPTYVHQQRCGMKPGLTELLEWVEASRPAARIVRLTHFAEVARVYRIDDLESALALQDLHGWADETIRQRFAYRTPGLFMLAVRVWQAAGPSELAEPPEYAGCKSWVQLEREIPIEGGRPVLSEVGFQDVLVKLDTRLPSQMRAE
jgi:hypothetical protein